MDQPNQIDYFIAFKSMIPQGPPPPHEPNHINTDLRLINAYLKNDLLPQFQPRNLSELSKVLANRLQHTNASQEDKQRGHEWLARKDFDIKPMLNIVKEYKKREEEEATKSVKTNAEVIQPTLLGQEEFLKRTLDSSLNSMLQYAATNHTIRRQAFTTLLRRLNCYQGEERGRSERYPQAGIFTAVRNLQKRKKYLQLTVELLKRESNDGKQLEGRQWALIFAQSIDHSLWKIIYRQVYNITPEVASGSKETLQQMLLINSLLELQKEFDQELPRNKDGITAYLEQRYLWRLQAGDYMLDSQLGCLWGKAFLLFRAGRVKELAELLEKCGMNNLSWNIQQQNKSIANYRSERKDVPQLKTYQKDIFRQQLQFALQGERKYSSAVISDLNSFDSIWILLRNTGVFYRSDSETFDEIRGQMVEYYLQNCSPAECTYFLAYLLSYDCLVRLGDNQTVDRDDYLHLLVLLTRLPALCPTRSLLATKLTETLIPYALEIARDEHPEPILEYYLTLLPEEVFLEEASSIIVTNKFYSRLSWNVLQGLRRKDFADLLRLSTEKYVRQNGDYVKGAETLMAWMQKQPNMRVEHVCAAIDMLLTMLIRNATNARVYDGGEIKQALTLIEQWIGLETEIERSYKCVLELFENDRRLSKCLIDRNYFLLRQFFQGTGAVFFNNIDFLRGKMFEKLAELEGTDVFFLFLRNVVRAADLVFTREASPIKSKDVRFEVLKMCKLVQEHERFGKTVRREALNELINTLQAEIVTIASTFQ